MKNSNAPVRTREEERAVRAAEFAWDLVLQLSALRENRGLSQAELARRVGTQQQAISRMENPGYDRQSLAKLREVVDALDAFVDVVIVPAEKASAYLECRYQPVLDKEAPFHWVELKPGGTEVPVTRGEQQATAWQSAAYWHDDPTARGSKGSRHVVREDEPKAVAA